MVVPPPIAAPCTAAISGLSKSISAFISRACGESPGPGGFFRKSSTSFPAEKDSPAPCQSTTRVRSSLAAALKMSARASYMREVIAFLLVGRFSSTRRTFPHRSVMISSIARLLCPPSSELSFDATRSPGDVDRSVVLAAFEVGHVALSALRPHRKEISCLLCAFALPKAQRVAHSLLFGPQIGERVRIRRNLAAEQDDHLDVVLRQCTGFARIVREQANPFDAEIAQDRGRQSKISAVGLEPESMIGLDRIDTGILQLVSLQLRHQADASAFLILIDHGPAAFFGDGLHGHFQLVVAITAQRPEHL